MPTEHKGRRPLVRRLVRRLARVAFAVAAAAATGAPLRAQVQVVTGGDFDIDNAGGTLSGNRARLTGRAGFGTNRAAFVVINAADATQDVDRDGYTPGIDFTDLVVSDTSDFVNVADPSRTIFRRNLVIADFLNPVRNGFSRSVGFYVNIPDGTPAGTYLGRFTVTSPSRPAAVNPTGQTLRVDFVEVEIVVVANSAIGLVQADAAIRADSLTLRGRPGQTVSGVVRIANLGNSPLENVRLEVTDLIATSGTGLRIRAPQVSFSPATLNTVAFADTQRVVVSVRIPAGILAGAYRGELIAQGDNVAGVRIPITVVVTTPGDVIFDTNPVIGRSGENAIVIVNADPGSRGELAVFDLRGIIAYRTSGTVFAGTGTPTTPAATPGGVACGNPSSTGDEAVRTSWALQNGVGEAVAGGMYYVIVNALQCGSRRQLRGKLMVIR
jgi:hypothetical protein